MNIKKFISLLLSAILILSFVTPVFATDYNDDYEDSEVLELDPDVQEVPAGLVDEVERYEEENKRNSDDPDNLDQIYDPEEYDYEETTTGEEGAGEDETEADLAKRPRNTSYVLLALSSKFAGEKFRLYEKGEDKGEFTLDAGGKMYFPLSYAASSTILLVRDGADGTYQDIDPHHDEGGFVVIEVFLGDQFANAEFYFDTTSGREVKKADANGIVATSVLYDKHYDFFLREYFDYQDGEIDTTSALLAKEPVSEDVSTTTTATSTDAESQKDVEKGFKVLGIAIAIILVVGSAAYVLLFKKETVASLLKKKKEDDEN